MAEKADLGKISRELQFWEGDEEVAFTGKSVPAESRLLSVEQILQVPQDLLHLLLGTFQYFSPSNVCTGKKFEKNSSSGQAALGPQDLIRIGQAALVLLLILLLSALPLLLLGIARR